MKPTVSIIIAIALTTSLVVRECLAQQHFKLANFGNGRLDNRLSSSALRLRRSPLSSEAQGLQSDNQQALDEQRTIFRNQLAELIARARNDKSLERVLLKMWINSSSGARSGQLAGNMDTLTDLASANGYQAGLSAELADANLARLQQAEDKFAGLDEASLASDLASQAGSGIGFGRIQGQLERMDKREYTKPCFFNPVSCAKNPYRKL